MMRGGCFCSQTGGSCCSCRLALLGCRMLLCAVRSRVVSTGGQPLCEPTGLPCAVHACMNDRVPSVA